MEETELTYEQALGRLEKLTSEMEGGQIGIDEMADRLREAQKLLDYCKQRLTNAEKSCNLLLNIEENV
ncbi:MAG: exodeoxyribonuclease VII small subunit [Prevotellaceae bacterium]|nr:exodeoxyribonuclease VII small subunit [Prevotellaceae bacterium]